MSYRGTITALITPFHGQELDHEGLGRNIDHQIAHGINGILALGSTGEPSTLSDQEQARIISLAVEKAHGKVPVWVGTGSNCTRQTIEKTRRAKDLGADVALIVTPYYNRPTQEGIFRHFEAVATSTKMPFVVYNNPGRCGINIERETLMRIAALPNAVGMKEGSDNLNHASDVMHAMSHKYPHFLVFSGNDGSTLPMIALGAAGVVSVISNLVSAQVIALTQAALQGNFRLAKEHHYRLLPLFRAAFVETNPIPIKAAMQLCGMPAGDCRLPLCAMDPQNLHSLRQLLAHMQLLKD